MTNIFSEKSTYGLFPVYRGASLVGVFQQPEFLSSLPKMTEDSFAPTNGDVVDVVWGGGEEEKRERGEGKYNLEPSHEIS